MADDVARTKRHRRSLRLNGYDYSRVGAYFVTLCTQDRACLFGNAIGEAMQLDDAGRTVQSAWDGLPQRFTHVELDAFVVMPNHIHGILWITKNNVGATLVVAPSAAIDDTIRASTRPAPTIGDIIGAFKSLTTVAYTRGVKQSNWPMFRARLWQRNYYEHIIRDDESLNRIRQYIADNPTQWATDRENPANTQPSCIVGAGLVPARDAGVTVNAGEIVSRATTRVAPTTSCDHVESGGG